MLKNCQALLHESGKMDHDAFVKKAQFIQKSVEVRTMFNWAPPHKILTALKMYASLYLLGCCSEVLLGVSKRDKDFFVVTGASCVQTSAKTDIICRYPKFF